MQEETRSYSPDYDDVLMRVVERALSCSPDERKSYLRSACGDDPSLLRDACGYVEREERMNGFLLEPILPSGQAEQGLNPGDLLENRFRIVRKVAQGGMGVVYEAQDEKLGRRIAIKCAKADFDERLPPEVRNASEISHPNVCKIFEIHSTTHEGVALDFLTMEFLEGETLYDRLRRGPLGMREAKTIGRQLCAGLAEAHRNQVIHADLKSGNVILTRAADGGIRAVITDFGLAMQPVAARLGPETGPVAGTPDYMAPELLRGGSPSVASDLYALGVILFQLALGRKPFPPDVLWPSRIEHKPPTVKHPWNPILQRCLDANPERRPREAGEVERAIAPPAINRRSVAVAAVLAALAILVSVGMYLRATGPQETVRLAVLPFASGPEEQPLASRLAGDTSAVLAGLAGSRRTKFTVIPAGRVQELGVDNAASARRRLGVTHVIRGRMAREGGRILLQAWLVDAGSMSDVMAWKGEYDAGEMRFPPVAIAAMVTGAFHLPPVAQFSGVSALARVDYEKGLSYLRRDSTIDAALPYLERAVAADPDSAVTHAALAEGRWWKVRSTGDKSWRQRAAESVREAERRNPDLAAVHGISGQLMAGAGRHEPAKVEFLRSIELDAGNGDVFRRLGAVYEELEEHEKALAAYRQAVKLAPDHYRNHQALGSYWIDRANYREAIRHFRRTVELEPGEPAAHFALAVAVGFEGRFSEAEAELRTALAITETPRVLNSLGSILMYQNRDGEAVPYFRRAVGLEPDKYLSWMNLGSAYRRLHRNADSARSYRRALQLIEGELSSNPKDVFARACLAYVCAWAGERDRARTEIAQALQLAPTLSDVRRLAVKTYEALKRRDDALAVLRESPPEVLADVSRYPDLADLHRDSRFLMLLGSKGSK